VDVVGEPVEESAGQALGGKYAGPLIERQIAGDVVAYQVVHLGSEGERLLAVRFQEPEFTLGQIQALAQASFRGYWKREGEQLEPIKSRKPVPNVVTVLSDGGKELCRWSFEDEWRAGNVAAALKARSARPI
jgi:hypothetical protein